MDDALELGRLQETVTACRERAAEYDWSRIVERYESVYDEAARPSRASAA
jgi:glycosyltransferase involved in cell wall biosynthesis